MGEVKRSLRQFPRWRLHAPRLPRIATDQTRGLLPVDSADTVEVMLATLRAIEMGCDVHDISATIHPHPTLSETVAFAAEMFDGTITDLIAPKKTKKTCADLNGITGSVAAIPNCCCLVVIQVSWPQSRSIRKEPGLSQPVTIVP